MSEGDHHRDVDDHGAAGDGGTPDPDRDRSGDGETNVEATDHGGQRGFDLPRLGRTIALIGFVTAVFVLVAATRLSGTLLVIGVAAIGAVAMVTAITGALIAAASTIGRDAE